MAVSVECYIKSCYANLVMALTLTFCPF